MRSRRIMFRIAEPPIRLPVQRPGDHRDGQRPTATRGVPSSSARARSSSRRTALLWKTSTEAPTKRPTISRRWVDPGTCLRAASGMNTTAIKDIVDQAQERGIKYVLLDTGWYGSEYDVNCDPRLDPPLEPDKYESDRILLEQYFATEGGYNNTGEGVFTRGKASTSIRIWEPPEPSRPTWTSRRSATMRAPVMWVFCMSTASILPDSSGERPLRRGRALHLFFKKWGVKGVKPGFVHVRAQQFELHTEGRRGGGPPSSDYDRPDDMSPPACSAFPNLFCTERAFGR